LWDGGCLPGDIGNLSPRKILQYPRHLAKSIF
jgi:hypothetical protein